MTDSNLDKDVMNKNLVRVAREFNRDHGTSYKVPMTGVQKLRYMGLAIGGLVIVVISLYVHSMYYRYRTMSLEYNAIIQESNTINNISASSSAPSAPPLTTHALSRVLETPRVVPTIIRPLGVNIKGKRVSIGFPDNPVSNKEFSCLTEAVYFESTFKPTKESFSAMVGVAEVIINRKFNKSWPKTLCKVISQGDKTSGKACQFSYRCDGKSDRISSKNKLYVARIAAYTALVNNTDITNGATFYYADYVSPKWRLSMIKTAKIGAHIFMRRKQDSIDVMQSHMVGPQQDLWLDSYIKHGGDVTK